MCELAGYGHSTDLHHLTQPDPTGSAQLRAMNMALAQSGFLPSDIGYVNAHGTGTKINDVSEAAVYEKFFKDHDTRVSSTKAALGHTLGAAGAVEAVLSILALLQGKLPPQKNLVTPEPAVKDRLVKAGEQKVFLSSMSVNLGFGGSNAALIFSKYEGSGKAATNVIRSKLDRSRGSVERQGSTVHRKLTPSLEICGIGAVSPLGLGADAISSGAVPQIDDMDLFDGKKAAVYRVAMSKECLAKWQKEPRLRRASPITFTMMEAASQVYDRERFPGRLGIVSSFFTGSINYSRRFFSDIIEQGQRFASPALFPETVFNSPTSHVAHVLKAEGPAYSIVGDQSAWVNSIATAWCWLTTNTVDYVLVIAAEELDPVIVTAYRRRGWMKQKGFIPSEGAGAMLLKLSDSTGGLRITELAEGFSYRSRQQAMERATACMRGFSGRSVLKTARNNWFEKIENQILKVNNVHSEESCALGEAFVASAAWNTFQGMHLLRGRSGSLLVPIWGLNHQCSALLLENHDTKFAS